MSDIKSLIESKKSSEEIVINTVGESYGTANRLSELGIDDGVVIEIDSEAIKWVKAGKYEVLGTGMNLSSVVYRVKSVGSNEEEEIHADRLLDATKKGKVRVVK